MGLPARARDALVRVPCAASPRRTDPRPALLGQSPEGRVRTAIRRRYLRKRFAPAAAAAAAEAAAARASALPWVVLNSRSRSRSSSRRRRRRRRPLLLPLVAAGITTVGRRLGTVSSGLGQLGASDGGGGGGGGGGSEAGDEEVLLMMDTDDDEAHGSNEANSRLFRK